MAFWEGSRGWKASPLPASLKWTLLPQPAEVELPAPSRLQRPDGLSAACGAC